MAIKEVYASSANGSKALAMGNLGDLAGLIVRTREHLHDNREAEHALAYRLDEAADLMHDWATTLTGSGTEPPLPRAVSAKLGWWRRLWRERKVLLAQQTILEQALPWLEAHRDTLIAEGTLASR